MKLVTSLLVFLLTGCGYHVAERSSLLPETLHTIAIPAFSNTTIRYKLTDRMPQALAREFISRTHYRIVDDPATADAVLTGTIINYANFPTIFDPATQRANVANLRVNLQVMLKERATGRILFQRPNFEVTERYQISPTPAQYFEESDFALNRASEQVARQVVTSVLENF